jgi:hypothetical protein
MMMIGLLSAVLGLAVAYAYSTVLGALLFLIGAGLLWRGYAKADPPPKQTQRYENPGNVTYNISSGKKK